MESIEPYLTEHSADEDRAWLDAVRRELWMEKRA
jgi:hypothetical protein